MRLCGKQDKSAGIRDRRNEYRRCLRKCPDMSTLCDRIFHDENLKDAFAIDCVYAAIPVLQSYLVWVLERAAQKQIKRLYFLARDGYLMCRMAKCLAKEMELDIECRYLYASRYAWRIPAFHLLGDGALDYICRDGMNVTFRKVMERSGVLPEVAVRTGKMLGLEKRMQEQLNRRQLSDIRNRLAGCRMFLSQMGEMSEKAYDMAAAYLEQEGLFENIPWAVVDSGWTGSLQDMLQRLLYKKGYRKTVTGFYFGLYSLPAGAEHCSYEWFYFGPYEGASKKAGFCNNVFECMYSAPHGMTVGYAEKDNRIVPVFSGQIEENCRKAEREEALIKKYIGARIQWKEKASAEYLGRKQLRRIFYWLMEKPLKEETLCWGTFLFSDDVTENIVRPLAEIMEEKELRGTDLVPRLIRKTALERRGEKVVESAWEEGSLALAESRFAGWHRMNIKCYRYLLAVRTEITNRRNCSHKIKRAGYLAD